MHATQICLGEGNSKIGLAPTFSLPSGITCPGASEWCRSHCYGHRYERLRPVCRKAYARNLQISFEPSVLASELIKTIPPNAGCLRIHVTGDFYSAEYTEALSSVCQERSEVLFWGYSRSWRIPSILPALEHLRELNNVQLFASTDSTMPLPPEGWRVAFLENDSRAKGMPCKEQQQQVASCLACGYCFRKQDGNVVFKIH